jgi:hypothetical protein
MKVGNTLTYYDTTMYLVSMYMCILYLELWQDVANTLAFYDTTTITLVKSFMVLNPEWLNC